MAIDSYRYRDPLEVLIAKESRTCKGCAHEVCAEFRIGGQKRVYKSCSKSRKHGRRCRQYLNPTETQ
jgi:hypothetical protein